MGGRTGRGEQVRSSPCIKLKARVLLQLSCLTTALDRCAEQEWCHHCLCKLSFEEKQKGLPGTRHRWLPCIPSGRTSSGRRGHIPAPGRCRGAPRTPVTQSLPEGRGWGTVGLSQHGLEPSPAGIRVPPVPRLAQGTAWKQQAPSQLLFSSASLGTFPVVTARTLEGLPEPKHSRRRSPPPPDIDSRGSSRS